ncbi:hypothetical protein HRbin30_03235 [bacterium HR30]|nr:hypothetical protein HRbin30_03235 [bacterium HR30]
MVRVTRLQSSAQHVSQNSSVVATDVGLEGEKRFDGVAVRAGKEGFDPPLSVWGLHVRAAREQVVLFLIGERVGCSYETGSWVDDLWIRAEREQMVPISKWVLGVAHEQAAPVAGHELSVWFPGDGTVGVSVNVIEIERPEIDFLQGVTVLADGTGLGEAKKAVKKRAGVRSDVAERQVDTVVVFPARVNNSVWAALPLDACIGAETHCVPFDMFADGLPTSCRSVPRRVIGSTVDPEEIPRITICSGYTPGKKSVVAIRKHGAARKQTSLDSILGALEVSMIPKRGQRKERHVGVIRQDRVSRGRACASDRPVVAPHPI